MKKNNNYVNGYANAVEAAWSIAQNKDLTLRERHNAWNEIVTTMPDFSFNSHGVYSKASASSIHTFLSEYMAVENRFLEQFFKKEPGTVYTYKLWNDEEQAWIRDDGALYADFDAALTSFKNDADLNPTFAFFSKRYIGPEDKRLHIRMRPDGAIHSVENSQIIYRYEILEIFFEVFFGLERIFKNEIENEK